MVRILMCEREVVGLEQFLWWSLCKLEAEYRGGSDRRHVERCCSGLRELTNQQRGHRVDSLNNKES